MAERRESRSAAVLRERRRGCGFSDGALDDLVVGELLRARITPSEEVWGAELHLNVLVDCIEHQGGLLNTILVRFGSYQVRVAGITQDSRSVAQMLTRDHCGEARVLLDGEPVLEEIYLDNPENQKYWD